MVFVAAVRACEARFGTKEQQKQDCLKVFEILESRYRPPAPDEKDPWGKLEDETDPTKVAEALVYREVNARTHNWDENPITELSGGEDFLQDNLSSQRGMPHLSKEAMEENGIYDDVIKFADYADDESFFVPSTVMDILAKKPVAWTDLKGNLHQNTSLIQELLGVDTATPHDCYIEGDVKNCGFALSEKATPPGYNRNYIIVKVRKPVGEVTQPISQEPGSALAFSRAISDFKNAGYNWDSAMEGRAGSLMNVYALGSGVNLADAMREIVRGVGTGEPTTNITRNADLLRAGTANDYVSEDKKVMTKNIVKELDKALTEAESFVKNEIEARRAAQSAPSKFDLALEEFKREFNISDEDVDVAEYLLKKYRFTDRTDRFNPYEGHTPEYGVIRKVWLGVNEADIVEELGMERVGREPNRDAVQQAVNLLSEQGRAVRPSQYDRLYALLTDYSPSDVHYAEVPDRSFSTEYAILRQMMEGFNDEQIVEHLRLTKIVPDTTPRMRTEPLPEKFPIFDPKVTLKRTNVRTFVSEWTERGPNGPVTKKMEFTATPEQSSYLNHITELHSNWKTINKEFTSLVPLRETPIRMTISNSPWDQLTKSGKCFGRDWDSCEMPSGVYASGAYDDVAHWNGVAIFRWGDLNKKRWDGRMQMRWCETPADEDGGHRSKNIGIEERLYPQGGGRPGEHLRPHPLEMAVVPWMKGVLKKKGYGDYKLCISPYKQKGYDDMMNGWIAGKGFEGDNLYELAPGSKTTEVFFGDDEERKEAFLERYAPPEPEPEPEPEEEEEPEYTWDSWWDYADGEYAYSAVLRNDNPNPEYADIYVSTRNLARWAGEQELSPFYDNYAPEDASMDSLLDAIGYTEVSSDDDDYLSWVSYPDLLNDMAEKLSEAGIEALAVTRPATSVDPMPITDLHIMDAWHDFSGGGESRSKSFKDTTLYTELGSILSEFENCAYDLSLTARERRSLERWPSRESTYERLRTALMPCAVKVFKDVERANTTRDLGEMPGEVKVEVFDGDYVRDHDAITPSGQPGPLFSICAVLRRDNKYTVSSKWSGISPKGIATATRGYLKNVLNEEERALLNKKCEAVTNDMLDEVVVKNSEGEFIHAFNPFTRRASDARG